jgi:hypothetical protein
MSTASEIATGQSKAQADSVNHLIVPHRPSIAEDPVLPRERVERGVTQLSVYSTDPGENTSAGVAGVNPIPRRTGVPRPVPSFESFEARAEGFGAWYSVSHAPLLTRRI